MKTRRRIPIVLAMLAMALFATWRAKAGQSAQTPNVVNAKSETRAVSGTLAATLHGIEAQADKPEWVGYSVPQIAGDRTVCCGNFNDGLRRLRNVPARKRKWRNEHEFWKRGKKWNRGTGRFAPTRGPLPFGRQASDARFAKPRKIARWTRAGCRLSG